MAPVRDGAPAASSRGPTKKAIADAAEVLRRLLTAVEAGELGTTDPKEVALTRRLQGVLVGWETALGQPIQPPDHGE